MGDRKIKKEQVQNKCLKMGYRGKENMSDTRKITKNVKKDNTCKRE